jgi:hypothetical protein
LEHTDLAQAIPTYHSAPPAQLERTELVLGLPAYPSVSLVQPEHTGIAQVYPDAPFVQLEATDLAQASLMYPNVPCVQLEHTGLVLAIQAYPNALFVQIQHMGLALANPNAHPVHTVHLHLPKAQRHARNATKAHIQIFRGEHALCAIIHATQRKSIIVHKTAPRYAVDETPIS